MAAFDAERGEQVLVQFHPHPVAGVHAGRLRARIDARGRAWALSIAVIALPYYERSSPAFAALAARMIDEVLTEH